MFSFFALISAVYSSLPSVQRSSARLEHRKGLRITYDYRNDLDSPRVCHENRRDKKLTLLSVFVLVKSVSLFTASAALRCLHRHSIAAERTMGPAGNARDRQHR